MSVKVELWCLELFHHRPMKNYCGREIPSQMWIGWERDGYLWVLIMLQHPVPKRTLSDDDNLVGSRRWQVSCSKCSFQSEKWNLFELGSWKLFGLFSVSYIFDHPASICLSACNHFLINRFILVNKFNRLTYFRCNWILQSMTSTSISPTMGEGGIHTKSKKHCVKRVFLLRI